MEKFLLSLLCLLTVGFAGQAETIDVILNSSDFTIPGQIGGISQKNNSDQFTLAGWGQANSNLIGLNKNGGCLVLTTNKNEVVIKSITLSLKSGGSKGYTIDIYSSDSPYSRPSALLSSPTGTKLESYTSKSTTFESKTFNLNSKYFAIVNSGAQNMTHISQITICYEYEGPKEFPTECAQPVFTIDGEEATGVNLTAYAGSKIAVSCATKGSEILWDVKKGNEEKGTNIEGSEYVIPADAQIGDTYTFAATASIQGETELLTASDNITLTIAKAPLRFTFDFVNNAYELGERGNSSEYQATNKDFTESISGIRVQTADANMRLWSDGLRFYSGSSITFTAPNGYAFKSTSFESTQDSSFSASLSTDNKTYIIKRNPSGENKAIKTVTLEWVELPAVPELESGDFSLTENELKTEEKTLRINFTKVEGLDIYYSLKADATAVTPDEGEGGKVTRAEGEGHTHDAAFQLHDGNEIELNNTHTQLSYFACDPATGMHSETKTLALTIGATGVAEIEAAEAGEVRWFDMQGREVKGQPAAGVYVRVANGKAAKVIVK